MHEGWGPFTKKNLIISNTNIYVRAIIDLGHIHSKQMFLCRFVFAHIATDALSHHQHEVLLAAAKCHQVLVGVCNQQFLNSEIESILN